MGCRLLTRVWFRGFGRPDRRKILGGVGEEGAGEVVRTCGAVPFGVRASRLPLRLGLLDGGLEAWTVCAYCVLARLPGRQAGRPSRSCPGPACILYSNIVHHWNFILGLMVTVISTLYC